MTDHTRLRETLSMIEARYASRSARAGAPLPGDDAAEIIDVMIAECGAELTLRPATARTQQSATRHTLRCFGIADTAAGSPANALLAWTLSARATLQVEDAA